MREPLSPRSGDRPTDPSGAGLLGFGVFQAAPLVLFGTERDQAANGRARLDAGCRHRSGRRRGRRGELRL